MPYSGYNAYKTVQNKVDDPRDTEYRLLAQVTAAMIAARDNSSKDLRDTIDAVLWNSRIWSAFRVDLSAEDNQLPKDLRASLLSLSIWVEREAHAVMDGQSNLDALIEVNRNIMAGLKPDTVADPSTATVSAHSEATL